MLCVIPWLEVELFLLRYVQQNITFRLLDRLFFARCAPSRYCAVHSIPILSPINACMQVHGSKRLSCYADCQETSRCPEANLNNPLDAGDKAHKQRSHPGFETQGRHHQKSKTGVSVAPQKKLYSFSQRNQHHSLSCLGGNLCPFRGYPSPG